MIKLKQKGTFNKISVQNGNFREEMNASYVNNIDLYWYSMKDLPMKKMLS